MHPVDPWQTIFVSLMMLVTGCVCGFRLGVDYVLRRRERDRTDEAAHRGELSVALKKGDRVRLEGRVAIVGETSAGEQWVMVALDGEPSHTVACWTGNTKEGPERR